MKIKSTAERIVNYYRPNK